MDFTPTETQRELGDLTAAIVTRLVTEERRRAAEDAADPTDTVVWRALVDAGVVSAATPESVGGDGLGVLEQTAIATALGRGAVDVPYVTSVVVCADAIGTFGTDAQRDRHGGPVARGDAIATAVLHSDSANPAAATVTATRSGDGWTLSGEQSLVDSAAVADILLVPARDGDDLRVFVVDREAVGVTVTPQRTTSCTSTAVVSWDAVAVGSDSQLGAGAVDGRAIVTRMLDRALLGSAAFQYGVLDAALAQTADYTREREQFGRPIGGFQAVAQRLADAYIDVKAVRLAVTAAAFAVASGADAADDVRVAAFWAADAGHRVAHTVVHLHGGMGLDREHSAHRWFLAAKGREFHLGSATRHLLALGERLATDTPSALSIPDAAAVAAR